MWSIVLCWTAIYRKMYIITLGNVCKGTDTERGNNKNGDRHDIKMWSYWYGYSHYKDKTVSWSSSLYNGSPIPGKTFFILRQDPDSKGLLIVISVKTIKHHASDQGLIDFDPTAFAIWVVCRIISCCSLLIVGVVNSVSDKIAHRLWQSYNIASDWMEA